MHTCDAQELPPPVEVWGLALTPFRLGEALDYIDRLVQSARPSYFITANVHYAMLVESDPSLAAVNRKAAFLLADGMPLVWASRWKGGRLPERVAGADLIPALCARAAANGYRVFFLGGAPGVADEAARRLCARYEGLQVVGVESPPFRELSRAECGALAGRIRAARPDLLFVAFGQPKGEKWLADNLEELGVPVCVQVGASLDFAAGRVSRAPRLVQRLGMEWAYRLYLEPGRLLRRYAANGWFGLRMLARDLAAWLRQPPGPRHGRRAAPQQTGRAP
jgi:N-acetylglucosaminyldiphosphoundecaprenol N-acetyl-beta-D-mannosaminyltransferase